MPERERGLEDDLARGDRGAAVAPLDLVTLVTVQALARAVHHEVADAAADPLAPRARVHRDGPAHGARDADAELEPGELGLRGLGHDLGKKRARARGDDALLGVHAHARELVIEHDDGAVVAGGGGEHVGALAQDDPVDVLLCEHVDDLAEGGEAVNEDEQAGGTADTVRRAARELLVAQNVGVGGARKAHVGVEDAHLGYSFASRSRIASMKRGPIWVTSPAP